MASEFNEGRARGWLEASYSLLGTGAIFGTISATAAAGEYYNVPEIKEFLDLKDFHDYGLMAVPLLVFGLMALANAYRAKKGKSDL